MGGQLRERREDWIFRGPRAGPVRCVCPSPARFKLVRVRIVRIGPSPAGAVGGRREEGGGRRGGSCSGPEAAQRVAFASVRVRCKVVPVRFKFVRVPGRFKFVRVVQVSYPSASTSSPRPGSSTRSARPAAAAVDNASGHGGGQAAAGPSRPPPPQRRNPRRDYIVLQFRCFSSLSSDRDFLSMS